MDVKAGRCVSSVLRDSQNDTVYVEALEYLPVGRIPVSFEITSVAVPHWRQIVPIDEAIIRSYLSSETKGEIKKFKSRHKDCTFFYFQVLDAY